MIQKYDLVRLMRDIPDNNLVKGDMGTVVMIHTIPGLTSGYEVEFISGDIYNSVTMTLQDGDIEKIEQRKVIEEKVHYSPISSLLR